MPVTQMQLLGVLGLDVAAWLSLHPAHIWDFEGDKAACGLAGAGPKVGLELLLCLFIYLFIFSN